MQLTLTVEGPAMSDENSGDNTSSAKAKPQERKPLTGQALKDAILALRREAEARINDYPPGYSPNCDRSNIYGPDEDETR